VPVGPYPTSRVAGTLDRMSQVIHRARRLRAAGYTESEIGRMVRSGSLSVVRRGSYVEGAPPDDDAARHVLLVHATVPELAGGAVASHISAAVLHGLPAWGVSLNVVQVTRGRSRSGARQGRHVHLHCAPVAGEEIVIVGGTPCTDPARTVVDVARTAPFTQAVVVADAALRRPRSGPALVDRDALNAALDRAAGWPGAPAARRAIAFADGRSESVGESRSRVAIAAGLPAPVLQYEVWAAGRRRIGWTDFGWPKFRTVGEFDGRVKYGRLLKPGEEPGDAVYAEKLREDDLRDQDLGVVRWTWPEISCFDVVAQRLRRRFDRV
jgi:hypothetical protein